MVLWNWIISLAVSKSYQELYIYNAFILYGYAWIALLLILSIKISKSQSYRCWLGWYGPCYNINTRPSFKSTYPSFWFFLNALKAWPSVWKIHFNLPFTLHKKLSFPLRISSIIVTKYTVYHFYWRNPLWKTSFFVQWLLATLEAILWSNRQVTSQLVKLVT